MRNLAFQGFVLMSGLLVVGCGDSSASDSSASGGVMNAGGKATSSGGSSPMGGASPAGGTLGTGGVRASGGTRAAGGDASAGGATTGVTAAIGGTVAAGGSMAIGGSKAVGGTRSLGGSAATAGSSAVVATTGGTSAVGGSTATGGTSSSGGDTSCPTLPAAPTGSKDAVAGTMIEFNDNGAWCWYQDERAIVDASKGKLIVGSVAAAPGSRNGNIEASVYDIATGSKKVSVLGNLSVDDHNAPAFALRPDGKYVAVWATHRTDCNTYYSIYDGSAWSAQKKVDWKTYGCPWNNDNTHMITYSNVWYMGSTLFDIARSVDTSPNLLASTDDGQTWSYYGRLTYTPLTGYVAGYYKYWGNNTDRIDFLGTEAHPRDNDNNLWHGYMKDGKIYNSLGTVVDDALAGTSASTSAKNIDQFTKVFATGSTINGVRLEHAWNHDLVRYDDGTIAALWQARVSGSGNTDPDKRMLYARFDGTTWKLTYLVKAGKKLYDSEQDYVGLGALHPNNPHIIYVSTTFDPRDDKTQLAKHEIFQGITCDNGATWKWIPVTQGSTMDNLRPIVPKWDDKHTALLWMRGSYTSAQNVSTKVVGVITEP